MSHPESFPNPQASRLQGIAQFRCTAAVLASVVALIPIAYADYVTDWSVSLSSLYLVPVAIAIWFGGLWTGVLICCLTALIRVVISLASPMTVATDVWNAGMFAGELLAFAIAMQHFRQMHLAFPVRKTLVLCSILVIGLAALVFAVSSVEPTMVSNTWETVREPSTGDAKNHEAVASHPADELPGLCSDYAQCMRMSRSVLLGSRDPATKSCVTPIRAGELTDAMPNVLADVDGGVGTKLSYLTKIDRLDVRRPTEDFAYHQQRLRRHLRNQLASNEKPLAVAAKFADRARAFADWIDARTTFPTELSAAPPIFGEDYPGFCLSQLNQAVAEKDLGRAQRWAATTAAAAFSLVDLHRWLAFLVEDYLAALDFQRRCEPVYTDADARITNYNPMYDLGFLPAGSLTLLGCENFLEVERQAEQIFTMPPGLRTLLALETPLHSASSMLVHPSLQASFLQLENALSATNRRTLAAAARAPYEHSYLTAMLNRAQRAGKLEPLIEVVRRFDASHARATMEQLMDVLMDRGTAMGGFEWGDRFQDALLEQAAQIQGSDRDAFQAATRRTNDFYRQSQYGPTLTLRQSLELHRLDCTRATDMIAAIYRDAGRTSVGYVRWCTGTFGHTVAAYLGQEEGQPAVLLADGLDRPNDALERWPKAYYRGHRWPPGLEDNPAPSTAELYVRGLDSYVWAEGYVVRGSQAGTLMSASIPYLPDRTEAKVQKVFDGPYPN